MEGDYVYRGLTTIRGQRIPTEKLLKFRQVIPIFRLPKGSPSATELFHQEYPSTPVPKRLLAALTKGGKLDEVTVCDERLCAGLRWGCDARGRCGHGTWKGIQARAITVEHLASEEFDLSALSRGKGIEIPDATFKKKQRFFQRVTRRGRSNFVQSDQLYQGVTYK